jgi:hypothetical protein
VARLREGLALRKPWRVAGWLSPAARGYDFQGDLAIERGVPREKDGAVAAASDLSLDDETGDSRKVIAGGHCGARGPAEVVTHDGLKELLALWA